MLNSNEANAAQTTSSAEASQPGAGQFAVHQSPPSMWPDFMTGQVEKPVRVLLVDDVMTTGATAAACGTALMAAGAAEVRTAVVARTSGRS